MLAAEMRRRRDDGGGVVAAVGVVCRGGVMAASWRRRGGGGGVGGGISGSECGNGGGGGHDDDGGDDDGGGGDFSLCPLAKTLALHPSNTIKTQHKDAPFCPGVPLVKLAQGASSAGRQLVRKHLAHNSGPLRWKTLSPAILYSYGT